jgi:hypothetical protein
MRGTEGLVNPEEVLAPPSFLCGAVHGVEDVPIDVHTVFWLYAQLLQPLVRQERRRTLLFARDNR